MLQVKEGEESKLDAFFSVNSYITGAYDDPKSFKKLNEEIKKLETNPVADRIFYLALPPSVFIPATQMLKDYCQSET